MTTAWLTRICGCCKRGDIIDTIWYAASYSGDDDFEAYTVDTLTVTANTAFDEIDLPDGSYSMVFEMWDAMGNSAYSDAVLFDCDGGDIITNSLHRLNS
jgi:hypothetical protein